MNKKNLLFSLLAVVAVLKGISQCENTPNIPENVNPLYGCEFGIGNFEYMLESKDNEITGGNPDYTVTYHETQDDANNGTNPIDKLMVYIVPIPGFTTLYARVVDGPSGCVGVVSFVCEPVDVYVNANPTPLEVCDSNQDGFESFDLTLKDSEISTIPNQAVSYFDTEIDAINNSNPLTTPYTNTQVNTQVIYARVVNTLQVPNYCYKVVPLTLQVNDCMSVNKETLLQFALSPNPVTNILTISSKDVQTAKLSITTINGKSVMQNTLSFKTNNHVELDVSQWPRGLYFARLKSETKSIVKKLIIK